MVFLGKIVKVRGNKGEVVCEPTPEFSNFFKERNSAVLLKSEKYRKKKILQRVIPSPKGWILKFKDVDSINAAYLLVGYSLYGVAAEVESEDENKLVGFRVKDQNGEVWGRVVGVSTHKLHSLLEIQNGDEILQVPEGLVSQIDDHRNLVIINAPDGLRDLNK